jgi:hypothetical protein
MFSKFSACPVRRLAVTTTAIALLPWLVSTSARAEDWSITLDTISDGAKIDVYDVGAKRYVVKDKSSGGSISIKAAAKMGVGWDPKKVGAHVRWVAKRDKRCWTGQVCATRDGATASTGPLRPDMSVAEGNCHVEGDRPACGGN